MSIVVFNSPPPSSLSLPPPITPSPSHLYIASFQASVLLCWGPPQEPRVRVGIMERKYNGGLPCHIVQTILKRASETCHIPLRTAIGHTHTGFPLMPLGLIYVHTYVLLITQCKCVRVLRITELVLLMCTQPLAIYTTHSDPRFCEIPPCITYMLLDPYYAVRC